MAAATSTVSGMRLVSLLHAWTTAVAVAAAGWCLLGRFAFDAVPGETALQLLLVCTLVTAPVWMVTTVVLVGLHATSDVSSTERALLVARVLIHALAASLLAFDPSGALQAAL